MFNSLLPLKRHGNQSFSPSLMDRPQTDDDFVLKLLEPRLQHWATELTQKVRCIKEVETRSLGKVVLLLVNLYNSLLNRSIRCCSGWIGCYICILWVLCCLGWWCIMQSVMMFRQICSSKNSIRRLHIDLRLLCWLRPAAQHHGNTATEISHQSLDAKKRQKLPGHGSIVSIV